MDMFEAFADELMKIALGLGDDPDPQTMAEGGEEPQHKQEPDVLEEGDAGSPDDDAVGGFASSETRRHLSGLLKGTEGREEIRNNYRFLRDKANEIIRVRKALTRGLLRSRRDLFGPSATPRTDLRRLLYDDEPYYEATYAQ